MQQCPNRFSCAASLPWFETQDGGGRAGSEFASEAGRIRTPWWWCSERSGRNRRTKSQKARQEFSEKPVSSWLKRDDVAKELRRDCKGLNKYKYTKLSLDSVKSLKKNIMVYDQETPTDEIRDVVNDGVTLPMNDPVIPGNEITKRLEASHIVSMDRNYENG